MSATVAGSTVATAMASNAVIETVKISPSVRMRWAPSHTSAPRSSATAGSATRRTLRGAACQEVGERAERAPFVGLCDQRLGLVAIALLCCIALALGVLDEREADTPLRRID